MTRSTPRPPVSSRTSAPSWDSCSRLRARAGFEGALAFILRPGGRAHAASREPSKSDRGSPDARAARGDEHGLTRPEPASGKQHVVRRQVDGARCGAIWNETGSASEKTFRAGTTTYSA